jgi:membrane protease YdiL (CAAX protease family)
MLYTPLNNYAFTSIVKVIFFTLCPLIYFKIAKEGKYTDLFARGGDKKSIKQALILALIVFIFIFAAFAVINPWLDSAMIIDAMSNVGITSGNYIFAVLYYVIVNVALEEWFFRGFVFLTLYKMNQNRYAYIYSSMLFAIYHIAVMKDGVTPILLLLSVIGLVIVGLLFNEIARRCGNAIGSFAVHASASLAISLCGYAMLFG